ncbi:MAG: catalase [Lachnospiraceae bacterium]|nr:catalase [Lachnospiraceae bacterium]
MNVFGHFKTITKHKILVMKYCFRLGLYKQGLLHDMSKYSPTEFIPGCKYYQGIQSPNNAEREANGVSLAWLHHKGRNKHHYEYWIDYGTGENKEMQGMKIPNKYMIEMFCDRLAASKNYNGKNYTQADSWEYYEKGKQYAILHPESRALLEKLLYMLKEEGEEKTFEYIRKNIKY